MHRRRPTEPVPTLIVPGDWNDNRLVLVSYHFPPAQTVGALRWEKLAWYAAERGLSLDVVSLAPESLVSPDWSRVDELPPGTRVFGVAPHVRALERLDRLARRLARPLLARDSPARRPEADIPQLDTVRVEEMRRWRQWAPHAFLRAYNAWLAHHRDLGWAARAASAGTDIVQPGVHRAIVSSGPPHSAHEAARRVAERTGLPFVMDLRDPWSLAPRISVYDASPLALSLARRLERRAVNRATLIVTVTEPASCAMRELYPHAARRIITVLNGYDEEPLPDVSKRDRFTVAYAGAIYIDRDPRPLFRGAARTVHDLGLGPEEFGIEFIGPQSDFGGVPLLTLASREGLQGHVTVHAARPRREALEFLAKANMLVNLPQDLDLQIPAKVFEYVRFDAWLLILAERGSATELLFRDSGADIVVPSDIDAIANVLRHRYAQFRAGVKPEPIANRFNCSRRQQAQILFDALEAAVGQRRAATGGDVPV